MLRSIIGSSAKVGKDEICKTGVQEVFPLSTFDLFFNTPSTAPIEIHQLCQQSFRRNFSSCDARILSKSEAAAMCKQQPGMRRDFVRMHEQEHPVLPMAQN